MSEQLRAKLVTALWWDGLTQGERDLWMEEAGSTNVEVCYELYWSRGAQLEESELKTISKGYCPACRMRGFVIGPAGGAMLNIECAHIRCRDRFNILFVSGKAMIGHRLGNGATGPDWPSEPPRGDQP